MSSSFQEKSKLLNSKIDQILNEYKQINSKLFIPQSFLSDIEKNEKNDADTSVTTNPRGNKNSSIKNNQLNLKNTFSNSFSLNYNYSKDKEDFIYNFTPVRKIESKLNNESKEEFKEERKNLIQNNNPINDSYYSGYRPSFVQKYVGRNYYQNLVNKNEIKEINNDFVNGYKNKNVLLDLKNSKSIDNIPLRRINRNYSTDRIYMEKANYNNMNNDNSSFNFIHKNSYIINLGKEKNKKNINHSPSFVSMNYCTLPSYATGNNTNNAINFTNSINLNQQKKINFFFYYKQKNY